MIKLDLCFPWKDAKSLEDWVRRMICEGNEADVVAMMRFIPENLKPKYRVIWKEEMSKRKEKKCT